MRMPTPLIAGEPVRESWSHQLVDHLRSSALRGGVRSRVSKRAGGAVIVPSAPPTPPRQSFDRVAFGAYTDATPVALFKGGVQFAVLCVGSDILVRRGSVSWSNVVLEAGVHPDDSGAVTQGLNRFEIDCTTSWTANTLRYVHVEIDLEEQAAYLRLSASADMPLDDPSESLVRWILATVSFTSAGQLRVVETWHVGHIKMPAVYAPPIT